MMYRNYEKGGKIARTVYLKGEANYLKYGESPCHSSGTYEL